MSRKSSKISIHCTEFTANTRSTVLDLVFPKKIPELVIGPVYDACGFTLKERLALRQAWKLIKPFQRRYGKEILFEFLMKHYEQFDKFRVDGKLDLHRLHRHSLSFMRLITSIIEEKNPVIFQSLLNDNYNLHCHAHVDRHYMELMVKSLTSYVLDKLKDVSSSSIENGFQRLLDKFQSSKFQNDCFSLPFNRSKISFAYL